MATFVATAVVESGDIEMLEYVALMWIALCPAKRRAGSKAKTTSLRVRKGDPKKSAG